MTSAPQSPCEAPEPTCHHTQPQGSGNASQASAPPQSTESSPTYLQKTQASHIALHPIQATLQPRPPLSPPQPVSTKESKHETDTTYASCSDMSISDGPSFQYSDAPSYSRRRTASVQPISPTQPSKAFQGLTPSHLSFRDTLFSRRRAGSIGGVPVYGRRSSIVINALEESDTAAASSDYAAHSFDCDVTPIGSVGTGRCSSSLSDEALQTNSDVPPVSFRWSHIKLFEIPAL